MLLKIGHRGAKAYKTENTLESFGKAIELGANAIELDVRRSKDGLLIISHDDTLKKVYGKDTPVSGSTLSELKQLTHDRIATLEEGLHFIGGKVEKILVELKEPGYEQEVLGLIAKEHMREKVILISFLEEALARIRDIDRDIETGLVYTKPKKPIETALKLKAQYLVALYRFMHRRDVAKAHKENLKVIVWTINTKKDAQEYAAKDVDGIASDKPDILQGISSST